MSLKQLCEKVFKNKNIKTQSIGIYTGPGKTIFPDYADEILETHGDCEVEAYQYREGADLLLVQFKED